MENAKPIVLKTFAEVVEEVKKRNYNYIWQPETIEDLAEGPRYCACKGVPASRGADLIMREFIPKINKEKCTKCGSCWMFCPLGVIYEDDDGYFCVDEEYCRACGICAKECPTQAIEMAREIQV